MADANDEAFYEALRERAAKWRRDQSARQSLIDARYAARAEAVIEADVARMLAESGEQDDGRAQVETR